MIWISLGPMRIPMVSPGVQARVEWMSHSRPSHSTCISKWTPLKMTSLTTPTSWPSTGETTGSTADIKVGDVVEFTGTKHYVSATATSASSCKPGKAKVTAIAKGKTHPYHLIAVSGGGSTVYGWTDAADIKTSSSSTATSYLVKVTTDVLNIRKGPGTNYGTNGAIRDKGTYTIVAESDGPGASKWGKLKSGAGWISLDYTKKV